MLESEESPLKLKKNNPASFDSAKAKTPTRLGEIMTDGLPTLVIWNFLFLLSCISIITIGPAMAAMSFCTNALVMDDRPHKKAAKLYLHAFRVSFIKALPIGLCFLLISGIFGMGFFVYSMFSQEQMTYIFMSSLSLLVLLLFWSTTAHLYPLLFDFEKTDWENHTPVLVQKNLRTLISEAGVSALARMIPTAIGLIFSILCLGCIVLFLPATVPLLLTLAFSAVGVAMALAHTPSE
ncbi:MAG: DUF624 domain-containing protein [Lachnoclostridium sp.]|nr:DUF624 domain-containing protein [Lachnoclostridium sp.]